MRAVHTISAVLILAAVAGCNTMSSSDYSAMQSVLKTDPEVRREAVADCAKDVNNDSAADRANIAAIIGVPVERIGQVFCTRLYNGIASGRISYEELTSFKRNGDYSQLIRELKRG